MSKKISLSLVFALVFSFLSFVKPAAASSYPWSLPLMRTTTLYYQVTAASMDLWVSGYWLAL